MNHFKWGFIISITLSIFLLFSCNESTEQKTTELPNLVGKWIGQGNAIIYGNLDHREVADTHTFYSMKFTLEIIEQKGAVFYGVRYSDKHSESIVGYIGLDNKSIFFADHDGYFQGEILDNESINIGYLEAGLDSRVAAIATYKRQE
ncbi:MAG: hypothetical protein JW866_11130 [Ignavibacteriales bacterium]|nr:hypothetical protein [Ignavibacteriales bacterium]